ncbi:MAG: hypothetical protein ACYDBB_08925 [Armatimonadota bacterium]
MWVRADAGITKDADGRIAVVKDQSGKGNDVMQMDAKLQPLLVRTDAGFSAIRFDGVDDGLALANVIPLAAKSVFAVVKWNQAKAYSFALGCEAGADGYLRMLDKTTLLTGGHYPILYQNCIPSPKVGYTPGDGRQVFHQKLRSLLEWNIFAVTDNPPSNEKLKYLGMNASNNTPENRFSGEIAEVLVYDRSLSAIERLQVEEYLEQRYLGWPAMEKIPVTDAAGSQQLLKTFVPHDGGISLNQIGRVITQGITEHNLPAGRYRLHCVVSGTYAATDTFAVRINNAVLPFTASGIDFTVPVVAPEVPTLARISWEGNASGADTPAGAAAMAQVLHIERLSPLLVTAMTVDKILYAPNQNAVAMATIHNYAAEPINADIRFTEITGLADHRVLGVKPVEVPAGGETTVSLPYNVGAMEYGRDLTVEIMRDGAVVESKSDSYSVADTLWKVAIGSPSGTGLPGVAPYSTQVIADFVRKARNQYGNWFEATFWAPDDWGLMTAPPGASWFSCQTGRPENTEKLQFQVKTAHELGMKALTYGKCMAGGPHGWELARARPQWFSVDHYGRTMGRPADVWDLDHWHERDKYKYADYKYVWTYRWVDLRRLDALDHGIDQLIASTRQFGWDGVRFDSGGFRAHFVDGKFDGIDSFNARNMRRTKERIWQVLPNFLFGFNTNDPVCQTAIGAYSPRTPTDPTGHEFREMLAGGGLWMFEGIRPKSDFFGRRPYKTWSDYAQDMVTTVRTIRGYGGHVCFSYGGAELYKYLIGTMIGAHDYVGEHSYAKGSENWGRFLTRWSCFLWDPRVRALPATEQTVQVAAERPLWWKEFANELVVSPTKRYVIIHLLNPPVNDEIKKTTDEVPTPIAQATLQVQYGKEKLVRAMFIAPGYPNRAEALVPQEDNAGIARFTLPRIDIWAMLVVELDGAYTVPQNTPAFTEPLNPQELAEMERCAPTPNVPVADIPANPTSRFNPDLAKLPDFGKPMVTPPAGFTVGGAPSVDVLVMNGFYHDTYHLPQALQIPGVRMTECTTRDLPKDYSDLAKYDVIVLVDMGAESWDANGQQRLADFVRAGGRLVILGGPFTLGQGFFKGTVLETVLPVEVRQARDVYRLATPLVLGQQKGIPFPGKPLLFYYHAVTPRPDARAVLWAGDLPIGFERAVGNGTTCVFTGTPMGEGVTEDKPPFWAWDGWPVVLGKFVLGGIR